MDFKLNKKKIYWILQLGGWSLYAIINIFFLVITDELSTNKVINYVVNAFYFLISTQLFRKYIIQNRWLDQPLTWILPKVIFATLILSLSNYIYQILISIALTGRIYSFDLDTFTILAYLFTTWIFYFLWALIYFIYSFFERINKSLQYEAAIYEIELNNLKSQLNPHFMFNALNSIRALVDEDPQKSKNAITKLSNILRNSLIQNRSKLIDFKDEINTVKDYLDLESIRYEERLKVEFDISSEAQIFKLPPLMLQTLVENGIKHGISKLKEGGKISITVYPVDLKLHIQIRNSGQLTTDPSLYPKTGYGIDNTKKRLNLIYGDEAYFHISNEDTNTVLTEIFIPQKK